MRKQLISLQEQREMITFYANIGKKYEFWRSGNSQLLFVSGTCYYSSVLSDERRKKELMPNNNVYFISKVKRHIEKNKLHINIKPNYKNVEGIKFFNYNKAIRVGDVFKGAYSVDIEKAYWRSAFNSGWVNDDLYKEGLGVHKTARLASLGSWAKNTDIYRFDGKEEYFVNTVKAKNPHVFFNQANTIFSVMEKCRRKLSAIEGFLFYWTDGLYVKDELSAAICEGVIEEAGFESHRTKLINIYRTESEFVSVEVDEKKMLKKIGGIKKIFTATREKKYPIASFGFSSFKKSLKNDMSWQQQKRKR